MLASTECLSIIIIATSANSITVMFSQTTYSVNETAGSAQPELVLSNSSSTDTTIEVFNTDGSATGEYCSILINIMV